MNDRRLEQRVVAIAEAALSERGFVTAIDIFLGLGWLAPSGEQAWRQGRTPYLEAVVTANLSKISTAMKVFRAWTRRRGLKPSETAYLARARGRATLRFSKSGNAGIERAYRTHWVSPQLSERKRERLAERHSKPPDLVVISPVRDWTCAACKGTGELLIMEESGPLCLICADMGHLVFLPADDAALTRRAKATSTLSAVVVRFSRTRKRYERQGILVEEDALAAAERQCLADEDARSRRRERDRLKRAGEDVDLMRRFTAQIEALFPGCSAQRAQAIARHAAARGSGRVGRTAAGQAVQAEAVELAVIASIRHEDTEYDGLLMAGVDRAEARERVRENVERALEAWRAGVVAQG
jgi:hypothetical protein